MTMVATLTYSERRAMFFRYASWLSVPLRYRVTADESQRIAQLRFVTAVTPEGDQSVKNLAVHIRQMPTCGVAEVIASMILQDIGRIIDQEYDWAMDVQNFPENRSRLRRTLERLLEIAALPVFRIWVMRWMTARAQPHPWN